MTGSIGFKDTTQKTSDVLQDMIRAMEGEHITLRDLLAKMGESGLLIICALISLPFLVPVSIPGVSTVFGAGIVLIGIAVTFNRLPWLPSKIADRPLNREKLVPVLERGVKILRKVDRFVKPRLLFLTRGAGMNRFNGLVLTAAGLLLMAPLGFIPFSNTFPGLAILFLSAGIAQRDGVLVLASYVMNLITVLYFGALAYAAFFAGNTLIKLGS
ncbi:MAG: exopolysaccharide biosynthesis protein [Asticcacaulis sp.]